MSTVISLIFSLGVSGFIVYMADNITSSLDRIEKQNNIAIDKCNEIEKQIKEI